MKTLGVILAGGNSTRFGADKSLYSLDGKPMYEHIADIIKASQTADKIVVSTNSRLKSAFSYETITDDVRFTDKGPLGGLFAAAEAYPDWRLLVISCDTPYIPAGWLTKLHKAALEDSGSLILTKEAGRLHPLIGIYQGENLAQSLETQLKTGKLSMRAFLETTKMIQLDAKEHGVTENAFVNINRRMDIL